MKILLALAVTVSSTFFSTLAFAMTDQEYSILEAAISAKRATCLSSSGVVRTACLDEYDGLVGQLRREMFKDIKTLDAAIGSQTESN